MNGCVSLSLKENILKIYIYIYVLCFIPFLGCLGVRLTDLPLIQDLTAWTLDKNLIPDSTLFLAVFLLLRILHLLHHCWTTTELKQQIEECLADSGYSINTCWIWKYILLSLFLWVIIFWGKVREILISIFNVWHYCLHLISFHMLLGYK